MTFEQSVNCNNNKKIIANKLLQKSYFQLIIAIITCREDELLPFGVPVVGLKPQKLAKLRRRQESSF